MGKDLKDKDPSEFEMGDDTSTGTPSRAGTPVAGSNGIDEKAKSGDSVAETGPKSTAESTSLADLPADVRVKLRRLEKMEPKYHELVKGYKSVYAKKQLIEPFEKALRENTSCTTIADPAAFVEYLNMTSLQAEMTSMEYKRVAKEYEELKKEVKELQEKHKKELEEKDTEIQKQKEKVKELEEKGAKGGSDRFLEPLSGLPAKSASPRPSPSPQPPASPAGGEDIFSFEDEHGKLEKLVQKHEVEIDKLKSELNEARLAQKVAEEAMQNNLETVENAQRELEGLKETGSLKDKEIGELTTKNKTLIKEVEVQQKEVEERKEAIEKKEKEVEGLETQINLLKEKVQELETEVPSVKTKEDKLEDTISSQEVEDLRAEKAMLSERLKTLDRQLEKAKKTTDAATRELFETKTSLERRIRELEDKLTESLEKIGQLQLKAAAAATAEPIRPATAQSTTDTSPILIRSQAPAQGPGTNASKHTKKRNKKKNKGKGGPTGAGAQGDTEEETPKEEAPIKTTENVDEDDTPVTTAATPSEPDPSAQVIEELKSQLSALREKLDEKDEQLTTLRGRMSQLEELKEEIETLRESLSDVGQDNVEAKEKIKELQVKNRILQRELENMKTVLGEKGDQLLVSMEQLAQLQASQEEGSVEQRKALAEQEKATKILQEECDGLQQKISALQSELSAAEKVSETRFKSWMDTKDLLAKKEPEINQLKAENANLMAQSKEANQKFLEMKKLEKSEQDLRKEVASLKSKASDNQTEIEKLRNQLKVETAKRTKSDEVARSLQNSLRKAEDEQKDAIDMVERTSRDLSRAQEDITTLRQKAQTLERELNKIRSEKEGLTEDLQMKVTQIALVQSSMSTMQDQAAEIATQMKETKARCESLEEDLADANRLLQERSREADTMRRLLNEAESRNEARFRDMKAKMDSAFEERDKAEEEIATIGRSRAKDIEELRNRVREAERGLKKAEEAKEVTERERKEYQSGKQAAESKLEPVMRELEETKKANEQMRDALDETERQMQAVEQRGIGARRELEELRAKYEKLIKSHKVGTTHPPPYPRIRSLIIVLYCIRLSRTSTATNHSVAAPRPQPPIEHQLTLSAQVLPELCHPLA